MVGFAGKTAAAAAVVKSSDVSAKEVALPMIAVTCIAECY
jgi:hypothetical protein